MSHALAVKISHGLEQRAQRGACVGLGVVLQATNGVKERLALRQVHDDVEVGLREHRLVHADDVGMLKLGKDGDLAVEGAVGAEQRRRDDFARNLVAVPHTLRHAHRRRGAIAQQCAHRVHGGPLGFAGLPNQRPFGELPCQEGLELGAWRRRCRHRVRLQQHLARVPAQHAARCQRRRKAASRRRGRRLGRRRRQQIGEGLVRALERGNQGRQHAVAFRLGRRKRALKRPQT